MSKIKHTHKQEKVDAFALRTIVVFAVIIALVLILPATVFAIDDVKDCVNPEHYDVKRYSDIEGKTHKGKKNKDCYTIDERDAKVKLKFEKWEEAVQKANESYTQKYNNYANTLNEKTEITAQLAEQDAIISEKQGKLDKAIASAYKQNYSGKILASLLLDDNMTETLNLKKYMDSTLEYLKDVSDDVKEEKQKKQSILDETNSHIESAKSELIDAAYHINDSIPSTSQELKDYIDAHGAKNYKEGRTLANKDLSEDWLIDVALYNVGTPYIWGGKSETGADCSGFTSMVYRTANNSEIGANTSSQCSKLSHIDKKDLQRGDVLFMENPGNSSQEHVGIFMEGNTYVHASGTGTLARVDSGIDYFTCGLRLNDEN